MVPSRGRVVPEAGGDAFVDAGIHVRYQFAAMVAGGRRVLDVACSDGRGSSLLLHGGALHVTGVDSDEAVLARARQRCPSGSFVVGDPHDLPVADQSFDMILCFNAPVDAAERETALDELARVLVADGLLLVSATTSHPRSPNGPRERDHIQEQLVQSLHTRFPFVQSWQHHRLMASALTPTRQDDAADADERCSVSILADQRRPDEAHAVVAASGSPLPELEGKVLLFAGPDIAQLAVAGEAIVAERRALAVERARLAEALEQAGKAAQRQIDSALSEQLRQALELKERHARVAEQARAERDVALLRLLDAEQQLAMATSTGQVAGADDR